MNRLKNKIDCWVETTLVELDDFEKSKHHRNQFQSYVTEDAREAEVKVRLTILEDIRRAIPGPSAFEKMYL